ncbi:MAG: DUF2935 domain-containing protein [Firmicutes bacterium]|nr:DUF2935 domain-containing protein [Bacillota bacterium]
MSESGLRFELIFWLQIMGDHVRIIKNSLMPGDHNLLLIAENFRQLCDRLLEKARQSDEAAPAGLIDETTSVVISLREFKRELLSYRLRNLPVTSLTPTFYNHMLNELEEFLSLLAVERREGQPKENIIGQHLLWSLDASGHAAALAGDLDKVEYALRSEAEHFITRFDQFYLEAVELAGYYRSNPPAVQSVLESYNLNMVKLMQDFMGYLEELKHKILKDRVLSRLTPLIPDHMHREGCYYLSKIARFQPGIPKPERDPARPRVE